MLSVYVPRGALARTRSGRGRAHDARERGLVRSRQPRPAEDKLVERQVGIAVPTREEMQEIEVSSRLYVENGARYMTATLMCQSDTDDAEDHAGHLHPVRPPADHRALRRAAAVHDRRQQARRAPARRASPANRC